MKKETGFTLLEMIIVVALIATLGLIFGNILTQTLRGQSKARLINQVKQNGQVILDRLSNDTRQARKVVCVVDNSSNPSEPDTIVLYAPQADMVESPTETIPGGNYLRFRFVPPAGNDNGHIIADKFLASDYPESNTPSSLCAMTTDQFKSVEYITNLGGVSGVSIDRLSAPVFKLDQSAGYNDQVTIGFKISQGKKAGAGYEFQVKDEGIAYSTTVALRGTR